MSTLSSLFSVHSSEVQSESLFDLAIQDVMDHLKANYAYIKFPLEARKTRETKYYGKSIGLAQEQCANINKYLRSDQTPTNFDAHGINKFLYHIDKFSANSPKIDDIFRSFDIRTVIMVPVLSNDVDSGSLTLYYSENLNVENDELEQIARIAEFLANSYLLKMTYLAEQSNAADQIKYYRELDDIVLVLNEQLEVIDANQTGVSYLGQVSEEFAINFMDYIEPEEQVEVLNTVTDLSVPSSSEIVQLLWSFNPLQNVKGAPRINFVFKKILTNSGLIRIIASGRVQQYKESQVMDQTLESSVELIPRLSDLKKQYFKNPDGTIEIIKTEMFPAAFVFVVNELSGPLTLACSPELDPIKFMQESIKLMAGLNTEQIVSQHYILGNTPWSDPAGELRWIAFYKDNPTARGNVEFHLIGIVTKQNLFAIMPNMIQISLGILLGAMNNYLEILDEDQADFTTKPYQQDRNFSTVALIRAALEEVRMVTSEIFAATLSGTSI